MKWSLVFIVLASVFDRCLKAAATSIGIGYSSTFPFAFTPFLNIEGFIVQASSFSCVVLLALGLLIFLLGYQKEDGVTSSFVCMLMGALSNTYDVVRYQGVIDMLEIRGFSIFNIADIMILVGACSLAIFVLRTHRLKSKDASECSSTD